ncbi:nucleoside deaminase [Actinospica sp. MGRD01-02]|uniref:Nucleoside deaminase n=1 Tax=Actinospica acidithermotolerans TaxID=2828514 RepID=A0A941EEY4_9ACTN|nr:nucleoside deaminase [Actinospica acidithermotolerans]MBR7829285.1 nucleoside deaminase [Actinospica acidithermotolerans]
MTADEGRAADDEPHLRRAVALAAGVTPGGGDLPFGAVVVSNGKVLAESANRVGSDADPTAHAEILALRAAGRRLGRADLSGAVLYSSGEPSPMCLAACLWARIERVVHAAEVADAADFGFEDREFYRQLAPPKPERSLRVERAGLRWRAEAVAAYQRWHRGTG